MNVAMNDLIEALQILGGYMDDTAYPTGCEHDVLYVYAPQVTNPDDLARLTELSFHWSDHDECWFSHRFGSA